MTVSAETTTPLLVSIRDAGNLLGVSRTVVYELMDAGSLPSVHIGARHLIRYADLQTLAEGRATVPTETSDPDELSDALAAILNVPAPAARRARRPVRRTDGGRRRAA
jgi:excisionase family DNA binding protein